MMCDRCGICGKPMPEIDRAINEGWYPCFWLDETTMGDGPVCPECLETKVSDGGILEPVLLPGVVPYREGGDR